MKPCGLVRLCVRIYDFRNERDPNILNNRSVEETTKFEVGTCFSPYFFLSPLATWILIVFFLELSLRKPVAFPPLTAHLLSLSAQRIVNVIRFSKGHHLPYNDMLWHWELTQFHCFYIPCVEARFTSWLLVLWHGIVKNAAFLQKSKPLEKRASNVFIAYVLTFPLVWEHWRNGKRAV